MSFVQHEDGVAIVEAPPQNLDVASKFYALFLGLIALAPVSTLLLSASDAKFATGMTIMFAGVFALATSLGPVLSGPHSSTNFHVLKERLELRPPASTPSDYREAPPGPELIIDGRTYPASAVTSVVLGHAQLGTLGVRDERWPVYLVVESEVVRVALLPSEAEARRLQRELCELFGVEAIEREGMVAAKVFAADVEGGLLGSLLLQLLALAAATPLGFINPLFAPLSALLLYLAGWGARPMMRKGMAKHLGAAAEGFVAGPVKVRVEDDLGAEADEGAPAELEHTVPEREGEA